MQQPTYQAPSQRAPNQPWIQQFCMPMHPYQGYAHLAFPYPNQHEQINLQQTTIIQQKHHRMFYCWTHMACFHPG